MNSKLNFVDKFYTELKKSNLKITDFFLRFPNKTSNHLTGQTLFKKITRSKVLKTEISLQIIENWKKEKINNRLNRARFDSIES